MHHFELNVDKTGLHLKATLDIKIADMILRKVAKPPFVSDTGLPYFFAL